MHETLLMRAHCTQARFPSASAAINSLRWCVSNFLFTHQKWRKCCQLETTNWFYGRIDQSVFTREREMGQMYGLISARLRCARVNDSATRKLIKVNVRKVLVFLFSLQNLNFKSDICGQTKSDHFVLWGLIQLDAVSITFFIQRNETF